MASLDLDDNRATYQVRAYAPGTLKINDQILNQSVIIAPEQLILDFAPQQADELTAQSLSPILEIKPDVLLIGTGATHIFISAAIYGELINSGIGVEVMDTSAACRTYNALAAEGRTVMAVLLIK